MLPLSVLHSFHLADGMHIWRRGSLNTHWGYAQSLVWDYPLTEVGNPPPHNLGKLHLLVARTHTPKLQWICERYILTHDATDHVLYMHTDRVIFVSVDQCPNNNGGNENTITSTEATAWTWNVKFQYGVCLTAATETRVCTDIVNKYWVLLK